MLTVTNLTKGSLEFHNDRFVDNYKGSLLDLVFQNNMTAGTSIFQSLTYLKSTQGR